eukprot:CAMPEP_0181072128 /NCGR_PEP_ID=MMETSP1070-20121207/28408_1 /TAXON_ID=265543 /ORGANISM="Minutocellus polymorphus, Strain NH13" /LENGTH=50 /DNA_ID=CAMNT_0023153167 /DNA_START=271 /DNA_END=423 /DNA_ORIENTATION=+
MTSASLSILDNAVLESPSPVTLSAEAEGGIATSFLGRFFPPLGLLFASDE